MSYISDKIRDRLSRGESFTLDEIAAYMNVKTDLELWSEVFHILDDKLNLIVPKPHEEMTMSFALQYLIRCIRENPAESENGLTGYEAAWHLADCLKLWASELPGTDSTIRLAEQEIGSAYREGDDGVRDRLVNGTLEHAVEVLRIRPFFAHWADDALLCGPWQLALDWALQIGDPTAEQTPRR